MSEDEKKLTDRVREELAAVPNVEEKRMFRGITFMVNGKMCVSVGDDRLMCRIDPALHDQALEKEGVRTVIMGGRAYRGFVHVDSEVLKTKPDLEYWLGLALAFNGKARASKKKKAVVS